jgi:diguanylate cyclase (GGDEF)-like protein
MRLATITNWAYGVTVALTLASGTTMLFASSAQQRERDSVAQRYALDRVTTRIGQDVSQLSELARQIAINGEASDLATYRRAQADLGTVEARTRKVRDVGAGEDELRSLHQALGWADALQVEQEQAISAHRRGDRMGAMHILFAPGYERELDRVRSAVERFQYRLDQRTSDDLRTAERTSRLWRRTSEATLAVTGLIFLCVLYFVFRRRVLHPVVKLSDVIGRLAAQDYAAEPPQYERVDEIGDMAQALRVFRENGIERQRLEAERDADRAVRDLLSRMTQRMQGCDSVDELEDVVGRFIPEVAPQLAGRLYLLDAQRNILVEVCSWLGPVRSQAEFPPLACWGLRRGMLHRPAGTAFDVPCGHILGDHVPDSHCLPLSGQHGLLGMLYFERPSPDSEADGDVINETYLQMLAENIGLALDNLRLREALRSLANSDPLTMLPNRRRLDEVLARALPDAEREGRPVFCAMIDIDHFKRFNDEHGHDAGDAVLRAVGEALRDGVREHSMVFRYGGEEFLMLQPDIAEDVAADRAEEIRRLVASLRVHHGGKAVGPVTISIGLAGAPHHTDWRSLLRTADAALLRAKVAGRDRVVVASSRSMGSVSDASIG